MKDQEFIVQKIRSQYTEQEHTELDTLKALDAKVKRPANVFGYTCGSLGALTMGGGMSLVMTDIGHALGNLAMIIGVLIGFAGMILVALAYPTYNRTLKKERAKNAPEILKLADELIKQASVMLCTSNGFVHTDKCPQDSGKSRGHYRGYECLLQFDSSPESDAKNKSHHKVVGFIFWQRMRDSNCVFLAYMVFLELLHS